MESSKKEHCGPFPGYDQSSSSRLDACSFQYERGTIGYEGVSVNAEASINSLVQRLVRPRLRIASLISLIATVVATWGARVPGGNWTAYFYSIVLWVIAALFWCVLPAIGHHIAAPRRLAIQPLVLFHGMALVVPVLFIGTVLMLLLDVPFRIAFSLSRVAMETQVQTFVRTGVQSSSSWAGVYRVRDFERVPGGVRFHVDGAHFDIQQGGFYYATSSKPANTRLSEYWHVDGPWYLWWRCPGD